MTESRDEAIDIVMRTLWGEARGEGRDGMVAVAAVICTRVARAARYLAKWGTPHKLFGDGTFRVACLQRKQFSCWNANDPNRAKLLTLQPSAPGYALAREVAEMAVDGQIEDPTGGATHYLTRSAYNGAAADHWCKVNPPIWEHGNHLFFKDP